MALCGVATLVLVALVLAELGASRRRVYVAVGLFALSPVALGPISLNTYDAWPALLTVLALWLFAAGPRRCSRSRCSGWRSRRRSTRSCSCRSRLCSCGAGPARAGRRSGWALLLVVAAAVVAPFAAYAPHGVFESFRSQAERGLQVESLGAVAPARCSTGSASTTRRSCGRPAWPGGTSPAAPPDAVAAVSSCSRRSRSRPSGCSTRAFGTRAARLPLAFAAAVAGFLAFTKVFSPQYLVWLCRSWCSAAARLASRRSLTAVALVLAQVWFFHYHALFRLGWPVWLLLARDLVLVALYVVLAGALTRWKIRIPSRSKTSRHSGLRRSQESWTAVGKGASRSA